MRRAPSGPAPSMPRCVCVCAGMCRGWALGIVWPHRPRTACAWCGVLCRVACARIIDRLLLGVWPRVYVLRECRKCGWRVRVPFLPPPSYAQLIFASVGAVVFFLVSFCVVVVVAKARTGKVPVGTALFRARDLFLWTAALLQTVAQIGQQVACARSEAPLLPPPRPAPLDACSCTPQGHTARHRSV